MSNKLREQGFVLVSVLLITSISTFLAFSALNEGRLQERIAGIQVKELNARAQAKKGLLTVVKEIEARDFQEVELAENIKLANNSFLEGEYALTVKLSDTTENLLNIESTGLYQDAVAYLNADVTFKSSNIDVAGAIIACDSIHISGSGSIDSYDSTNGVYGTTYAGSAININSNASVVTIDGDLNMTGGGTIMGSITANGNITQSGSAILGGNVGASGAINLEQANVLGNVSADLAISLTGGSVGDTSNSDSGHISSAESTVTLTDHGEKTTTGIGTGTIIASAGVINPDSADYNIDEHFSAIETFAGEQVKMTDNECNQKDIKNAVPDTNQLFVSTNMNDGMNSKNKNRTLNFGTETATVFNDIDDSDSGDSFDVVEEFTEITPISLESSLWSGVQDVYLFDDFYLSNTNITITGDVIIMVKGDLVTTGDASGFTLGAGGGSLTILVEGQTVIGSNTTIFENATIDATAEDPKIPLILYSSFESIDDNVDENAVYLNGATGMYAKVYAPLGNIEYAASGSMMGALEGKNVEISGDGSVHYDEGLALFDIDKDPERGLPMFASLYYHYPN